ncbi:hypothetical protein [Leptospira levettii]|uniref:hypothetical protein n=1 Tax=Leptospira levettii TaxID=2023178 RepID=UPI00223D4D2A|nr:hypothetical protein [Leptospira levettii]MCW7475589.1 hypothetical protein [Leptospira levettii]
MNQFLNQTIVSNKIFNSLILASPIYLIIANVALNDKNVFSIILPNLIPFLIFLAIFFKIKNLGTVLQIWFGLIALLSVVSFIIGFINLIKIDFENTIVDKITYISLARDLLNTIVFFPLFFSVKKYTETI